MPMNDVLERRRALRLALFWILFGLGLAARVFVAWTMRDSASSDHGIPCLMAKHIAEGIDFPVFYYGQPYMGSLEPLASALFCRIAGISGFAVNLGTVFFGLLLLPLVYAWGRRAGGAVAGLTALLFCVVGPFGFFQFQGWSYGGYAAIVFFCSLLVFGASRLVQAEHSGNVSVLRSYGGMGLAAGLAWWTAPHTLPAIITAAIILSVGVGPQKLLGLRALAGVLAFAVGSLPFWIWNLQHDWETFNFLMAGAHSNVWNGVRIFFSYDMLRVLGLHSHPVAWIGYVVGCLLFGAALWRQFRPKLTARALFASVPLLYLIVASLLAGGSRFSGTSAPDRYLLHLIPPVAVMLGCVTALLVKKLPWGIGLLPVLLIFGWHLRTVPVFLKFSAHGKTYRAQVDKFGVMLKQAGVKSVYAPYPVRKSGHALNFMLHEQYVFSDPHSERYPPYRQQIELAKSVAVLNNLDSVNLLLESTGGRADSLGAHPLCLLYNFRPPQSALAEIAINSSKPGGRGITVVDNAGNDVGQQLFDGIMNTGWQLTPHDEKKNWLEFNFASTQKICAIRIFSQKGFYAHNMQASWQNASGDWLLASNTAHYNGWYWSGQRVYFRSNYFCQEYRFDPIKTRAFRLYINSEDQRMCAPSELRIYAPAPLRITDETPLMSTIDDLDLRRVYAERWIANRIFEKFNGQVASSISRKLSKNPAIRLKPKMQWSADCALIIPIEHQNNCINVLQQAGIKMSHKKIGSSILFYFRTDDWQDYYADCCSIVWTGLGPLIQADRHWAMHLSRRADFLKQSGDINTALQVLQGALNLFEGLPGGIARMISWNQISGNSQDAQRWSQQKAVYQKAYTPQNPVNIEFGKAIKFDGINLSTNTVACGESVTVDYFWHCDPDLVPTDWAVFVHFVDKSGRIIFQDDHVLLEHESVSDQPVPVQFRERRTLKVPHSINSIRLGIYRRTGSQRRLSVRGQFSNLRRYAELPVAISARM
jgi:hypothetical protein